MDNIQEESVIKKLGHNKYQHQVNDLVLKLDSEKIANKFLQHDLSQSENKCIQFKKEIDLLTQKIDDAHKEISFLKNELNDTKGYKAREKKEFEENTNQHAVNLQEIRTLLTDTTDQLKTQIDDNNSLRAKFSESKSVIKKMSEKTQELESENEKYSILVSRLKKELDILKDGSKSMKHIIETYGEQVKQLKTSLYFKDSSQDVTKLKKETPETVEYPRGSKRGMPISKRH